MADLTPTQTFAPNSADRQDAGASTFDLIGFAAQKDGARLAGQLAFLVEIDKLKLVLRQTPLIDKSRRENDAEHSWHLAMMVLVLGEYAGPQVDLMQAIKMLLVHDIVEIDAGDTFLYDGEGLKDQEERELAAADRLFGILPGDIGRELRTLWDEFEAHESPTAQFARTMDRMQPFLHNVLTQGKMWRQHGVTADQVRARMRVIADGSTRLHQLVLALIEESVARGYLAAPAE